LHKFTGCSLLEARVPFDAFIQLALQLAWFKEHNSCTPVYETALTRAFLHGRTETIRSYTLDSRRFIKAMVNQQSPSEVLYRKFKAALQAHVSLTRKAVTGKGVDRHLLGLALVMRDDETSPLFDDSLYSKSQEWLLSTSGLSEGERFIGTG
jgi:hypothetical protein